jgi:hypothetical protein
MGSTPDQLMVIKEPRAAAHFPHAGSLPFPPNAL